MTNSISCPNCGRLVEQGARQCRYCQYAFDVQASSPESVSASVSASVSENTPASASNQTGEPPLAGAQVLPETLVPRLGDYLIEIGVLSPDDLARALEYQKSQAQQGHPIYLGQALIALKMIDREVLDQVVTQQLISLQAALRETNRQLEQRVRQRTQDLERRLLQIRTAAEVTQFAISAPNLDDLLKRTTSLLVERFGYYYASIFLLDEVGQQIVLREVSGPNADEVRRRGASLALDLHSIIGWVATNNQPHIAAEVDKDPYYLRDELLPDTRSEASIPLSIGEKVLGVLDVQHDSPNAFDADAVAILQTIANHIASVIQNFRLLESTQINLREISLLYETSHQISRVESADEVYRVAINALKQAPYVTSVLLADAEGLRIASLNDPQAGRAISVETIPLLVRVSITEIENQVVSKAPAIVSGREQMASYPSAFVQWLNRLDCKTYAFIPINRGGKLEALFVLGTRQRLELTPTTLEPYTSLAQLTVTALEKIYAWRRMEKSLTALQTLNTISQAVSVETDLHALYLLIHNQISQVMGDVNFIIAIYDPRTNLIRIPYMYDAGEIRSAAPFPLGEGLTSILLRTKQPLLIVEDAERRARELGAIFIGRPAKSWLGAPLLVGGEPIGAIIVQDLEREHRFDEEDQQLLITLASQVAAAVHNAQLLENTHRQAERERLLYEITSKIRSSTDIRSILEITASELSRALNAQRAHIQVGLKGEDQPAPAPAGQGVSLPQADSRPT